MSLSRLMKSALFLGFLGFSSVGFSASVEPIPASQLVVLDAEAILPLEIILFEPEMDKPLVGQVNFYHKESTDIKYELLDKNGASVWSTFEEISEKKNIHPFSFSDIGLKGEFDFKVSIINKYGDILGAGEREIVLEEGTPRLEILDLAVVDEKESLKVGFLFENDKVSRKVQPKVEIYYGGRSHLLVKEKTLQPIGIGGQQKKRFTLDIDKDFAPGLYLLEASVLSSEGKMVTGALQSSFFKRGNYVKMNEYELLLDEYKDKKKGGLWFTGRILEENSDPAEVTMILREGERVLAEKKLPLNVNKKGQFTGNFSFEFPELVSQFTADLKVKKGTNVLWEEVIDSPVFELPEDPIPVVSENLNLNLKQNVVSEKKSIPIYMYTLIIVLVALIALFFVIRSSRKQTFVWFLLLSMGTLSIGSVFAEDIYTVYWSHPVPGWGFTQDSASEFSQLHIEGAIFDPMTGKDFFDVVPTEIRIQFSDSTNTKAYTLPTNSYKGDGRTYSVTTDLSSNDYTIDTGNGTLSDLDQTQPIEVRVLFQKEDTNCALPTPSPTCGEPVWYATPATRFTIILDNKAPTVAFTYPTGTNPTKSKTIVSINCQDDGIGCFDATSSALNPGIPTHSFADYDVLGNFCKDAEHCDTVGARKFEVCDGIGNCTNGEEEKNQVLIDWYDPVPPTIESLNLWGKLVPHNNTVLSRKAFGAESFLLEYKDPNKVDPSQYTNGFDDNACGDPSISDFFKDAGICKQKKIACVVDTTNYSKRGVKDRSDTNSTCVGNCPTGYMLDSGFCIKKCSVHHFYPTALCFEHDSTGDGNGDSFCLDGACPSTTP